MTSPATAADAISSSSLPDGDTDNDEMNDVLFRLPNVGDSSDNDASTVSDCEHRSDSSGQRAQLSTKYDEFDETDIACLNFAMEHRIFLKAMLGLLAERDKKATEIGMNDPNVIKCGPLKKASHLVSGVWKVKFIELRRGMFSYYEDAVTDEESGGILLRKNVPLDFNSCSCRAVKIHQRGLNISPLGAIFELKAGGSRRFWLAKSRDERQAWIQAINDAMVNRSVTRGDAKTDQHGKMGTISSKSPFKHDLKAYIKVKNRLKSSKTKLEYVQILQELLGESLDIPIKWIIEQLDGNNNNNNNNNGNNNTEGAFYEGSITNNLEQLRKDLLRDAVRINGQLFQGDMGHSPEKMIAALARHITEIGKSNSNTENLSPKSIIPESKAFAYSRDVLLSGNRTRSGGDSYYCVDNLCNNSSLVVVVPSSIEAEPLSISVSIDDSPTASGYNENDKSGWIRTRNRLQTSWRKRFFVLSEGTLSFFLHATPRPHGLRGQVVVTDATISVDRMKEKPSNFIISIHPKDGLKERYLRFAGDEKLWSWLYALECTSKGGSAMQVSNNGKSVFRILSTSSSHHQQQQVPTTTLLDEAEEVNAAATTTTNANANAVVMNPIDSAMNAHVSRLNMQDNEELQERIARLSIPSNRRVKISVQASTEYKVCTTDPQGDDSDTWAWLSADFLQDFQIINSDRIVRGEEIVRLKVLECGKIDNDDDYLLNHDDDDNDNNTQGASLDEQIKQYEAAVGATTSAPSSPSNDTANATINVGNTTTTSTSNIVKSIGRRVLG